jgi:calcineurin-like phosphoesterase family protein
MVQFVTSDTYLGREKILSIFKRPFKTVEEMNETIIDRWNSKVSKGDIVYHLGNFFWDPMTATDYIESLNGKIVIFPTQNDLAAIELSRSHPEKIELYTSSILEIPESGIVMGHYPMEDWNGKKNGTVHLHGHSLEYKTDFSIMKRVNCCTDSWDFYPVEIGAIFDFISNYENPNQ